MFFCGLFLATIEISRSQNCYTHVGLARIYEHKMRFRLKRANSSVALTVLLALTILLQETSLRHVMRG